MIDLTSSYKDDVLHLINCGISVAVDHISTSQQTKKCLITLLEYKPIEFLPFYKSEAILFARIQGVVLPQGEKSIPSVGDDLLENNLWSQEDSATFVRNLRPYAGYNPYLMNHTLQAAKNSLQ